jgi:hypothetical protein
MILFKCKSFLLGIIVFFTVIEASAQTITLNIAISKGQKDEVVNLLNNGYLPNGRDNRGNTPVNVATSYEQLEILQVLCDYGADINSTDDNGFFPLFIAASKNNLQMVELIVNQGAILDQTTDRGRTALIASVRSNQKESLEIIKVLQRNGADLNILDQYNRTALDYAQLEDVINFLQLYGALFSKDLE